MSMDTQGSTVGEMLRAGREAKKLSVEQVNRETRISVQAIRALESDDFGSFPSEIYLKGSLRTYADFLGLDGGQLWAMTGSRSTASGGGPAWEVEEAMHVEKLGAPRIIRRLVLPLLVILVIVLLIMLAREKHRANPRMGNARSVEASRVAG